MALALDEARASLEAGSYPIGAVLTIDDELFVKDRNRMFNDGKWSSHAEHNLFEANSKVLRETLRGREAKVTLYTTLEPCLMCLGIAVLHRVTDIIVACPDPTGGTARLDLSELGGFYQNRLPRFHDGPFRQEAYELMVNFFKQKKLLRSEEMLLSFERMRSSWA